MAIPDYSGTINSLTSASQYLFGKGNVNTNTQDVTTTGADTDALRGIIASSTANSTDNAQIQSLLKNSLDASAQSFGQTFGSGAAGSGIYNSSALQMMRDHAQAVSASQAAATALQYQTDQAKIATTGATALADVTSKNVASTKAQQVQNPGVVTSKNAGLLSAIAAAASVIGKSVSGPTGGSSNRTQSSNSVTSNDPNSMAYAPMNDNPANSEDFSAPSKPGVPANVLADSSYGEIGTDANQDFRSTASNSKGESDRSVFGAAIDSVRSFPDTVSNTISDGWDYLTKKDKKDETAGMTGVSGGDTSLVSLTPSQDSPAEVSYSSPSTAVSFTPSDGGGGGMDFGSSYSASDGGGGPGNNMVSFSDSGQSYGSMSDQAASYGSSTSDFSSQDFYNTGFSSSSDFGPSYSSQDYSPSYSYYSDYSYSDFNFDW